MGFYVAVSLSLSLCVCLCASVSLFLYLSLSLCLCLCLSLIHLHVSIWAPCHSVPNNNWMNYIFQHLFVCLFEAPSLMLLLSNVSFIYSPCCFWTNIELSLKFCETSLPSHVLTYSFPIANRKSLPFCITWNPLWQYCASTKTLCHLT